MNMVEEEPQNDNNDINNNKSQSNNIPWDFSYNTSPNYPKNFLHIIINTIINIGLLIVVILEFVVRGKNDYTISIFDILVTIFISFDCIFIGANYLSSKPNYLKGMIFYPFVTCFWGLGDFLSLFVMNGKQEWNDADSLKVTKFSLIGFNVFINIYYLFSCKNKI